MPEPKKAPWTAKRLDAQQTAMFDVVMGAIVPSLKAADEPAKPKDGK